MTEGERLRAVLAGAAASGSGGRSAGVPGPMLAALVRRIDTTLMPRRVTAAAGAASLHLVAAERRLVRLDAVSGVSASGGPVGAPLAFDDPGTVAAVAQVLQGWAAAAAGPLHLAEAPVPPGAGHAGTSPGIGAAALAAALGIDLWPDRSLPARLERWLVAVAETAQALGGHGALQDAGLDAGDPAALADAVAQAAPDGPGALLAAAMAGPAGGAGDEPAPLLAVVPAGPGAVLAVAGSPEGGVLVLAGAADLGPLVRAWQAA
jgi:hypothetical protein